VWMSQGVPALLRKEFSVVAADLRPWGVDGGGLKIPDGM
jgi:hypothetical protein